MVNEMTPTDCVIMVKGCVVIPSGINQKYQDSKWNENRKNIESDEIAVLLWSECPEAPLSWEGRLPLCPSPTLFPCPEYGPVPCLF